MSKRETKESKVEAESVASSSKAKRSNVFDTHGNDGLKAHIGAAQQKAAQQDGPQSALELAGEANQAPRTFSALERTAAVDEVSILLEKLRTSPALLAQVMSGQQTIEDQTMALMADLGQQLSAPTAAALATMTVEEIAHDLGDLVITSKALTASKANTEVEPLGALGAVLYDVISMELAKYPVKVPDAKEADSQVGQSTGAMELALQQVVTLFQFM